MAGQIIGGDRVSDNYKAPHTACKDCANRHYACHDTCEVYQQAKTEWIDRNRMIKRNKGLYYSLNKYEIEKTFKLKRR